MISFRAALRGCALAALVLLMALGAGMAEGWQWIEEPTPAGSMRLSGVKIGIDPGHQARANAQLERVSPNSDEMKPKVSSGTAGVKTRASEYQVNLDVSLQLRDALEALGCTVFMTRETNDVDISNQQRAVMMNDYGVDLVLRIHCNGSERSSANGIGLYVNATGAIAEDSLSAAKAILPHMIRATGAREDGIFQRDTYTGLNWSTVPCILVEMGYMSNPEEDVKLSDPEYQAKLVSGMVEGICAWLER
jgi:N-acetylmuramoyl-L-alanine amidase